MVEKKIKIYNPFLKKPDFEIKLKKLLELLIKEDEIITPQIKEITGRGNYLYLRELYEKRGFKISTRVDGYRYHKLLTPVNEIDIEKCCRKIL